MMNESLASSVQMFYVIIVGCGRAGITWTLENILVILLMRRTVVKKRLISFCN